MLKEMLSLCHLWCGNDHHITTTHWTSRTILVNVLFQAVHVEGVIAVGLTQHLKGYSFPANRAISAVNNAISGISKVSEY